MTTLVHRDISTWTLRSSTEDVIGRLTPESYLPSRVVLHRANCATLRGRVAGLPPMNHPRWPVAAFDLIELLFELYGPLGQPGVVEFCQQCAIGPAR